MTTGRRLAQKNSAPGSIYGHVIGGRNSSGYGQATYTIWAAGTRLYNVAKALGLSQVKDR